MLGVIKALEAERDEWKAKYEAAEFWNKWCYPEGATAQDVQNELTDYHEILENVPKVYMHITGGAMSKPHYHAEGVIAVADDHVSELIEEALKDHKEVCGCDEEETIG